MKLQKLLIVALVIAILVPKLTFAWGRKGHSLVAEVAFKNLTANTQKIVLKYLDGLSIEDAANWMDEQRGNSSLNYLQPLHYVNVEKGETYDRSSANNIIAELNRILSELERINTLSDETIRMDLYELFHLIGDMHQPFHVGYGTDKGGNTYQVQFNGHGSNIHKVWDSEIIEYANIGLSDIDQLNLQERHSAIDIYKWFDDSRSYMDRIYPAGHEIDGQYINANAAVIKSQLSKAGIRLSFILEKYFSRLTREPQFKKETTQVVTITIDKINDYVDQTVKVCTAINGTKDIGSVTFLNCGAPFPNSPLTAVIFKDDLPNFKNNPAQYYDGKNVCITGKVVLYKGKPEIILKGEGQIEVK
jgi:hypothetical protein